MSDTPRPHILLVDDDRLLLNGLTRLLRSTRRPVLTATTARDAGALLTTHEVGVIVCEPHAATLAAFLIEARERHPGIVRLILTGYPAISSVLKAFNEAHPFKLLTKPWLDDELLATVKLAFEQYAINRKRDRLFDEYAGIRADAERAHAFQVLGALTHTAHPEMNVEAIEDLPVGTLLLRDGIVALVNPAAQRILAGIGLPIPAAGLAVAALPTVLAKLVAGALAAPRRRRSRQRISGHGSLDYLVLDATAGTLIAFAPAPSAKQALA